MPPRARTICWDTYPEAIRLFLAGATVPVATRVGLVVGCWLTLVNQGSELAMGSFPWVKMALNVLTPFTVSSIGFLAARRRATLERLWVDLAQTGGTGTPPRLDISAAYNAFFSEPGRGSDE